MFLTHPAVPGLPRSQAAALVAVFAVAALAPLDLSAQTWDYKSYKRGGQGGQFNKDNFVMGSVTLTEADGKASVRLMAGTMDACRRSDLPAHVSRTEQELTIEPEITLAGCEKWRLVIRTDGSGGRREVWREDRWVDSRWDHGLTLRR